VNIMTTASAIQPQRTRGTGRLATKQVAGKTRLDVFYQEGAAKIRMPESFDGRLEAVLINTSGGLTGGDRVNWQVDAGAGTHVTVTTQACERVYKSSGGHAEVNSTLSVGAGATLHWLPQETILFDQGALRRRLDVDLAEDACFIGLEAVLLGRKAMGETVASGQFRDRWRIRRSGQLIHAEELDLSGSIDQRMASRATLAGHQAFATLLYCAPDGEAKLDRIRTLAQGQIAGASHWKDKLVVRIVASEGFELRKILIPIISLLRNGDAPPKVWHL
jgi:urease accessory protein